MGHQNPAAGVTGGKRWGPSPEWTRQSWFRPFEASATPERDHAGLQDTPAPAPKVTAMYLEFFGLREAPFELTPNPQFLFLTPSTRTLKSSCTAALIWSLRAVPATSKV